MARRPRLSSAANPWTSPSNEFGRPATGTCGQRPPAVQAVTPVPRPREILLATDLSHRCDRAFDRALQLTRDWDAHLQIVHALPTPQRSGFLAASDEPPGWYRPPDPEEAARTRIYRDLAQADPMVDFRIHTQSGSPAEVILDTARQTNAGLIITGITHAEGWTRLLRGSTIDRLLRQSTVPVLIVRDPVDGDYRNILMTTDFSPSSRAALQAAHSYFPAARLTLFHAYDVPYGIYLERSEVAQQFESERDKSARQFLADAGLPPQNADKVRRIIEYGAPDGLLRKYHAEFRHHLAVISTRGGGRVYETLVGGTGRKIAEAVPGDVLFIPDISITN